MIVQRAVVEDAIPKPAKEPPQEAASLRSYSQKQAVSDPAHVKTPLMSTSMLKLIAGSNT